MRKEAQEWLKSQLEIGNQWMSEVYKIDSNKKIEIEAILLEEQEIEIK